MDIHELDFWFSRFVRTLYTDHRGIVNCCTCGSPSHWTKMDCGHFIKRRYLNTRWDVRNAGPQCRTCNDENHNGQSMKMEKWIDENHGPGTGQLMRTEAQEVNANEIQQMVYAQMLPIFKKSFLEKS